MSSAASTCPARRVHPISSDFYVPCARPVDHDGPHRTEDDFEWEDSSEYALPPLETWACYPHGTRVVRDEKPTFDCAEADRSGCSWEKVASFEERHAHNMHILGLIRDEPAWALARILLAEQLEAEVKALRAWKQARIDREAGTHVF